MAPKRYQDSSYQYGTEAPKYPYKTRSTPGEGQDKKTVTKKHSRYDWVFISVLGTCFSIVFLSAFAFVALSSNLSEQQEILQDINTQIRETQSSINSTQAIIASHLDLTYIQKVATEQLQMAEPLPHQVVYIQLSEESYTVYDETP